MSFKSIRLMLTLLVLSGCASQIDWQCRKEYFVNCLDDASGTCDYVFDDDPKAVPACSGGRTLEHCDSCVLTGQDIECTAKCFWGEDGKIKKRYVLYRKGDKYKQDTDCVVPEAVWKTGKVEPFCDEQLKSFRK